MASEITVSASLAFEKGSLAEELAQFTKQFTMTGTPFNKRSWSVPTSSTAIPLGDVTTPGWCFIRNTDTTNYVDITDAADSQVMRLKAGEFAMFRFAITGPKAKANTAAVVVEYLLLQD